MELKDLRIGNYIKSDASILKHFLIYKSDMHIMTEEDRDFSFYEPILLTKEWLLKFGFEKDNDFGNWKLPEYEIYSLKYFHIGILDDVIYWYNACDDDYYSSVKKIDFVHSFQNLYFALTGKELTEGILKKLK